MGTLSPRVSIITATYNYSGVLRCAIQSVLRQTFQEFEHLVIGDGCTDDSADVVAGFSDPRLRWHNLPVNSGSQSAPNNKGIELARGEYIAYLGHDDLWMPTHLERLVETLDETGADWASCLALTIGPPGSGVRFVNGLVEPGSDLSEASFLPSTSMHTRALGVKIGGWRDYREIEQTPDLEFHERARVAGARFAHVDNLSTLKFTAAWRKNVYRERPTQEQLEYLERMAKEPDFLQRELLEAFRTIQFDLWKKFYRQSGIPEVKEPTAPRGARVEMWRRYRGLEPNPLTPRPWWEVARIRVRRVAADVTRPVRQGLRRLTK